MTSSAVVEVYLAHTGELLFRSDRLRLNSLREEVVRKADVALQDQIILSAQGSKVSASVLSSSLSALEDKEDSAAAAADEGLLRIYVFDKRHAFRTKALPMPSLEDCNIALPEGPAPWPIELSPAESASPEYKKLIHDLSNLRWRIKQASAYCERGRFRRDVCKIHLEQLKVQLSAILAALRNLITHWQEFQSSMEEFRDSFKKQTEFFNGLLSRFESNLRKLGSVEIHPVLKKAHPSRSTLLDFVSEASYRKSKSHCEENLRIISKKIDELNAKKTELEFNISKQDDLPSRLQKTADIEKLEQLFSAVSEHVLSLESGKERFQPDIIEAENTLNFAKMKLSKGRAIEKSDLESVEPLSKKFFSGMQNFEALDLAIKTKMEHFHDTRRLFSEAFYQSLSDIADLQGRIRNCQFVLLDYKETLSKKISREFSFLESLEKMPFAYEQSLLEIRRRKSFFNFFSKEGSITSDKFGEMRSKEEEHRAWFLTTYGRHVPRELLDLSQRPPVWEMRLQSLDHLLPDLDTEGKDYEKDGVVLLPAGMTEATSIDVYDDPRTEISRLQFEKKALQDTVNQLKEVVQKDPKKISPVEVKSGVHEENLRLKEELEKLKAEALKSKEISASLESKLTSLTSELETAKKEYEKKDEEQGITVALLLKKQSDLKDMLEKSATKISYHNLAVNDLVIFIKVPGSTWYEAICEQKNSYYLSHECASALKAAKLIGDYFVGRILEMKRKKEKDPFGNSRLMYIVIAEPYLPSVSVDPMAGFPGLDEGKTA